MAMSQWGIFLGTLKMNSDLIICPCCLGRATNWNTVEGPKPLVSFILGGQQRKMALFVTEKLWHKQQDFCHKKEERLCCYSWLVYHSTVKTCVLIPKNGLQSGLGIQFQFTAAVKWNELKWRQILFNYSPFYNFKLLLLPVAFSISSVSLQITQRMSSTVIAVPCCPHSFPFLFPVSGIWGEAHLFHMALGAIISSISMTSFIMKEASDAQHFSLGLEQSPDHSLRPVLSLTHVGFHKHTQWNLLQKLNKHVLM